MTDLVATDAVARDVTVRSAATGDQAAFAGLVREHHASMARVAFVICGDVDGARDAVQVAWTIAWRRIASLREPSRIRPWLVAIAANEARKAVAKRRRTDVLDISDAVATYGAADSLDAVALIDLRRALQRLRPDERELLAMRYAAGLDSHDIAEQLGLSASGVRSRLSRLVERLRAELAIEPEVTT